MGVQMKMTTVRLDEGLWELLEAAAEETGTVSAEIMRDGIRAILASIADTNEKFRARRDEIVLRLKQEQDLALMQALGVAQPTQVDADQPGRQ
jgi:predicted DNA-binding protein